MFDSLDDLAPASTIPISVTPDTVMVLRNAGPIGAPGMPEAGALPIPKKLGSRGVKDMVRISDARMSGTAFGTVVLHVVAGSGGRRTTRAGADGDRHPPRHRRAPPRSQGRRARNSAAAAHAGRRRRSRRAATPGSTSSRSPRPARAAISIS